MTTKIRARLIPARELAHAALAGCVIAYFKASKGYQEHRWRLGTSTPLTLSILATAVTAARWNAEKPSTFADSLHMLMRGSKTEDFDVVAKRLMQSLTRFQTTLFRPTKTLGGVLCYEMADERTCRRLIHHTAQVYGEEVQAFVDDVDRTFRSMRVFIAQADEARRMWNDRRQQY